jgi:hypothetical protein
MWINSWTFDKLGLNPSCSAASRRASRDNICAVFEVRRSESERLFLLYGVRGIAEARWLTCIRVQHCYGFWRCRATD